MGKMTCDSFWIVPSGDQANVLHPGRVTDLRGEIEKTAKSGEHLIIQVVPDSGPVGTKPGWGKAVSGSRSLSERFGVHRYRIATGKKQPVQVLGLRPSGGTAGNQPQGIHERQPRPVGPLGPQVDVHFPGHALPAQGHVSDEKGRVDSAAVRTQRITALLVEVRPGGPDAESSLEEDSQKAPRRGRRRRKSHRLAVEPLRREAGGKNDALYRTGTSDAQPTEGRVLARVTGKLYAGAGRDIELPCRQEAIESGRRSVHDVEPVWTVSFQYWTVNRITVAVINVPETKH